MEQKGCIHVYYGTGKGKTTAALGLALRASGAGKRVVLLQFMKGRQTGELAQLEELAGITVLRGPVPKKFSFNMNDEEKTATREIHDGLLRQALDGYEACDLLVLDEGLDAYQLGLLDEALFRRVIEQKPHCAELVITGHKPEEWVFERADYITEMVKHKHPYDDGMPARKGIEF